MSMESSGSYLYKLPSTPGSTPRSSRHGDGASVGTIPPSAVVLAGAGGAGSDRDGSASEVTTSRSTDTLAELGRLRRAKEKPKSGVTIRLFQAALHGDLRTIRKCLLDGASVHARDAFNNTPLHLAAGGGHHVAVKLLLEFGAIRTVINKLGHTPADRAAISGHTHTVKVLQTAGYSTAHKRREFVRNLLRGTDALPTAKEIIKFSGGSTDAGKEQAAARERMKAGAPVPPMMSRLLSEQNLRKRTEQRQFVQGLLLNVPLEKPGDPSVREVYRRFGGDYTEFVRPEDPRLPTFSVPPFQVPKDPTKLSDKEILAMFDTEPALAAAGTPLALQAIRHCAENPLPMGQRGLRAQAGPPKPKPKPKRERRVLPFGMKRVVEQRMRLPGVDP